MSLKHTEGMVGGTLDEDRLDRKRPTAAHISRRAFMVRASTAALYSAALSEPGRARSHRNAMLRGVNLAGAEFGQLIPGQHGRDYQYPGAQDFAFCKAQGFNVIRLPFKWDRLQPELGKAFDNEEWTRLAEAIRLAKRARLSLILDPHNYAHRRVKDDEYTVDHLIGSDAVPVQSFVAFWAELAARTKAHPHVIYGVMNEPFGISAETWLPIANATIAAIRSAGAKALILVPGVAYTGAHSWHAAENTRLTSIADPHNRFAIEVHQYLDGDSSGRSPETISENIGEQRIAAFESWAREHQLKAFLGEFGAGDDATSLKALDNLVRAVEAAPDVWIGWTAWAAGPWWPDSEKFRLSPSRAGTVPKQTRLLSRFARAKT